MVLGIMVSRHKRPRAFANEVYATPASRQVVQPEPSLQNVPSANGEFEAGTQPNGSAAKRATLPVPDKSWRRVNDGRRWLPALASSVGMGLLSVGISVITFRFEVFSADPWGDAPSGKSHHWDAYR